MAYFTNVDLAREAKIFSGDTANFKGSISLKNLAVRETLTLSGVTQYTGPSYKSLVIDEATSKVYKTTLQGGGGEDFLTSDLTVTAGDIGGIVNNETFVSGTTLEYLWRRLLTKVFYPELIGPSVLTTLNYTNPLYEIGIILNSFLITSTFDRGQILEEWETPPVVQADRAGTAIDYYFSDSTASIINQPQTGNTYSYGSFTVTQGYQKFFSTVRWNEGLQPYDSEGNPYDAPLPTGSTINMTQFEGVYPIFGSTASITISTKQQLYSMLTENEVELDLVAESGGAKQFFEIPTTWISSRPIVELNYYNTVSQGYDLTDKISDFTVTDITKNINGNTVNYKKYTNTSPDRGIITIKLIF